MAAREQAPLQQQQANKRPMGQQRMLWLYPPAAAAVAVRLALMGLGLGSYLAWRPEVTTPANGALYLREGVRMLQLGVSPYRGSNCHAPPLLLALFAPLAQHELLLGLPNVLADCCAAWCVAQLAAQLTRPQHGRAAQAADTGGLHGRPPCMPCSQQLCLGETASCLRRMGPERTCAQSCAARPGAR